MRSGLVDQKADQLAVQTVGQKAHPGGCPDGSPDGSTDAVLLALTNSANSTQPDETRSTLSIGASIINAVNCTLAPTCANLLRQACAGTAHTCGSCLAFSQYVGDAGDSNTACLDTSARVRLLSFRGENKVFNHALTFDSRSLATACWSDANCDSWTYCLDQVCVPSPKQCTNADQCNDAGFCVCRDSISGDEVTSCNLGDPTCSAACTCFTGFAGLTCASTTFDMEQKRIVRDER